MYTQRSALSKKSPASSRKEPHFKQSLDPLKKSPTVLSKRALYHLKKSPVLFPKEPIMLLEKEAYILTQMRHMRHDSFTCEVRDSFVNESRAAVSHELHADGEMHELHIHE